jgi:hypothetical protein
MHEAAALHQEAGPVKLVPQDPKVLPCSLWPSCKCASVPESPLARHVFGLHVAMHEQISYTRGDWEVASLSKLQLMSHDSKDQLQFTLQNLFWNSEKFVRCLWKRTII